MFSHLPPPQPHPTPKDPKSPFGCAFTCGRRAKPRNVSCAPCPGLLIEDETLKRLADDQCEASGPCAIV